jgi:hypothetical protein
MGTVTYTMFTYSLFSRSNCRLFVTVTIKHEKSSYSLFSRSNCRLFVTVTIKHDKFSYLLSSRSHCRHSPTDVTSQCVSSERNKREMPCLGRINTEKHKSKVISVVLAHQEVPLSSLRMFSTTRRSGERLQWLHTNPRTYTKVLNRIPSFSIFEYKLLRNFHFSNTHPILLYLIITVVLGERFKQRGKWIKINFIETGQHNNAIWLEASVRCRLSVCVCG